MLSPEEIQRGLERYLSSKTGLHRLVKEEFLDSITPESAIDIADSEEYVKARAAVLPRPVLSATTRTIAERLFDRRH